MLMGALSLHGFKYSDYNIGNSYAGIVIELACFEAILDELTSKVQMGFGSILSCLQHSRRILSHEILQSNSNSANVLKLDSSGVWCLRANLRYDSIQELRVEAPHFITQAPSVLVLAGVIQDNDYRCNTIFSGLDIVLCQAVLQTCLHHLPTLEYQRRVGPESLQHSPHRTE